MIGDVLGIANPADRDAGTIACVVAGTLRGASIFRVHNVHAVVQALRVIFPIQAPPPITIDGAEGGSRRRTVPVCSGAEGALLHDDPGSPTSSGPRRL